MMISKKFRVKNKDRFALVIKKKRFVCNRSFTMHYIPNDLEYSRIGITVSKKLGKAHDRIKMKRQVRHMVSDLVDFNTQKYDIVIIVRQGYLQADFDHNKKQLQRLYDEFFKKIGGTL